MTTNPVTPSDVESRWRPLTDGEEAVVASLIDDAWAQLLTYAPEVSGNLDNGSLNETVVISVLCAAVIRVMKNPDGNRSETVDDYSFTRDSATSAGALYFSDIELELVRGVRRKAMSVRYA